MGLLEPGFIGFGRIVVMVLTVIGVMLAIAMLVISAMLLRSGEVASDNHVLAIFNQMTVSYEISLGSVMANISIGFLIFGLILLFVSFFGFLGALFKMVMCLIVYGVLSLLVVGFEIFVLFVWFELKDELLNSYRRRMDSLLLSYGGNTGNAEITKGWNYIFLWFNCCGVNSNSVITDFDRTIWNSTTRGADKIPGYCCKNAMTDTAVSLSGQTCTVSPTPANSWMDQGCYDAINDYLKSYITGFLTIAFLIIFILIITIVVAFLLAYYIGATLKGKGYKKKREKELIDPVISVPQSCTCIQPYIPPPPKTVVYSLPPYEPPKPCPPPIPCSFHSSYEPPKVYSRPVSCYGSPRWQPYYVMPPVYYNPADNYRNRYYRNDYLPQISYNYGQSDNKPQGRYIMYPTTPWNNFRDTYMNAYHPRYNWYGTERRSRSRKSKHSDDETYNWYPSDEGRYKW